MESEVDLGLTYFVKFRNFLIHEIVSVFNMFLTMSYFDVAMFDSSSLQILIMTAQYDYDIHQVQLLQALLNQPRLKFFLFFLLIMNVRSRQQKNVYECLCARMFLGVRNTLWITSASLQCSQVQVLAFVIWVHPFVFCLFSTCTSVFDTCYVTGYRQS